MKQYKASKVTRGSYKMTAMRRRTTSGRDERNTSRLRQGASAVKAIHDFSCHDPLKGSEFAAMENLTTLIMNDSSYIWHQSIQNDKIYTLQCIIFFLFPSGYFWIFKKKNAGSCNELLFITLLSMEKINLGYEFSGNETQFWTNWIRI